MCDIMDVTCRSSITVQAANNEALLWYISTPLQVPSPRGANIAGSGHGT